MNEHLYTFLSLDFPALSTAIFAAVSCALLGNFLVLRKISLMGDAISHAVLPGIVVAFLLTGSRASFPIFLGAAAAGIVAALLIELVRKLGNVEPGASLGVIFSSFFALGVVLMEQAAARSIDLDAECLLHGQLETIFWYPPNRIAEILSLSTLQLLPDELIASFVVLCLVVLFILLFFKELTLSSFDPALGRALGFSPTLLHIALMILVAAAVVASFEAVGSILVIAMIICPAASARLLTDRLRTQFLISIGLAILAVVSGYLLASFGPQLLGFPHALSAAGMMATMCGALLMVTIVCAPRYGLVSRTLRRHQLTRQVADDDLLGLLFRVSEHVPKKVLSTLDAQRAFGSSRDIASSIHRLSKQKKLIVDGELLKLTTSGKTAATSLVRTHRLWEGYLSKALGLAPDHVHQSAETLEHFTTRELQQRLSEVQDQPDQDPHGKPIPAVDE